MAVVRRGVGLPYPAAAAATAPPGDDRRTALTAFAGTLLFAPDGESHRAIMAILTIS